MELNIEQKQQLEKLLAKPALVTQADIPFLQNLITTYPYYQPLHLLLAKASNGSENQHDTFTKAALYNNGSILHRIINEPQRLNEIEDIEIVTYQPWTNLHKVNIKTENAETENQTETVSATATATTAEDIPVIENLAPLPIPNEIIPVDAPQNNELTEENKAEETLLETKPEVVEDFDTSTSSVQDFDLTNESVKSVESNISAPEIENLEPLQDEVIKVCEKETETQPTNQTTKQPNNQAETDEQETFEEIGEIILPVDNLQQPLAVTPIAQEEGIEEITEDKGQEEISATTIVENIPEKTDDDIEIASIADTEFFSFEPSFSSEPLENEESEASNTADFSTSTAQQEHIVSKYDDDKLPFTFLWWLAKTRKDYEQTFRPFASPIKHGIKATSDLQQQYAEHIFHIQAPFEPTGDEKIEQPEKEKHTRKSEIIDTFIKNDPQIKAPKPDQINNENKAKRSSEDNYDLVSETLAQIYIEQMLYHKAIDTYQKLSLKFPEKSRYFADLIQSLEKKI